MPLAPSGLYPGFVNKKVCSLPRPVHLSLSCMVKRFIIGQKVERQTIRP
jgi:hypothetical protein